MIEQRRCCAYLSRLWQAGLEVRERTGSLLWHDCAPSLSLRPVIRLGVMHDSQRKSHDEQ